MTANTPPLSPLLDIDQLSVTFRTESGRVTAIDRLTLQVFPGEILGVVGESGCGKSVTSQAVMRLLDERALVEYDGRVAFLGTDLLSLSQNNMHAYRGNKIAMIFQDPSTSINPVFTIGSQLVDTILKHQKMTRSQAKARAIEMLGLTGIPSPERRFSEYPHQMSGGMKQRVMIAMALACEPDLLIADEPTTALDVTIQAQILDLLLELNANRSMSIVLITHDLGVVAEVCERVAVMYLGQVVEQAPVEELFARPLHPYTRGLLQSIPSMSGDRSADLYVIPGTVPSLNNVPTGCRFASRCPHADAVCAAPPPLRVDKSGHAVRCWHAESWGFSNEVSDVA